MSKVLEEKWKVVNVINKETKNNNILFKKGNIEIALIEERDIPIVLALFNQNHFFVTPETSARPTDIEFYEIIKENMKLKEKEDAVIVIRKNDICIGYISAFVRNSILTIGHLAVEKDEQRKGYGTLLVNMMQHIAAKQGRSISLTCYRPTSIFERLEFESKDHVNYFYPECTEENNLPEIYISIEKSREKEKAKIQEQNDSFKRFLKSPAFQKIKDIF